MSDLMDNNQERLRSRLHVLGLPKCYINPFIGIIFIWIKCSGLEWTISRLKSLKVDLFRRKAQLPPLTWIRKNSKGDISGPIGGMFRWADRSEKNFKICIQALMIYSYWIYPSVTEKQKKKFISAVTAPKTSLDVNLMKNIFFEGIKFSSNVKLPLPDPLLIYQGSPVKRSPRLFGRSSTFQNVNVLDELQYFNTEAGIYLYKKYERLFEPILLGFEFRKEYLKGLRLNNFHTVPIVGNIAFIQEPGGKLRSVASPFRLFQEVLKPFGNKLYRICERMPWDCTHNQSTALSPVQYALNKGDIVHSVDLSSATDFFPLELQSIVARSLLLPEDFDYINLWIELSQSLWKMPDKSYISWNRGQPLGMYPSFAIFTITHGLLLKSLLRREWNGEFYVLGDDVIILDETLAKRYYKTLDKIGCPYSVDKTLQSSLIAEFSSKIITRKGVYPQMKWRHISDDNFLDICKMIGPKSRFLLNYRQRKVFDIVKNLMEPIGLNFSLPGDNLEKMIFRTMNSCFYNPETSVVSSLLGLRRRINENLYSKLIHPDETISKTEVSEICLTFDEKVKSVFEQTIFNRYDSIISILDGLSSIPEALDLEPRLPLSIVGPSRVSTLERYEQIMKSYS